MLELSILFLNPFRLQPLRDIVDLKKNLSNSIQLTKPSTLSKQQS